MKKILLLIVVASMILSSASFKVYATSNADEEFELVELSDDLFLNGDVELNNIIGGDITPGDPTTPINITSGTYYINSAYLSTYLSGSGTSFSFVSGHVSTLSTPIKWLIQKSDTNGQYVIRMYSDTTKYIGASSTSSSNTVEFVTVSGTTPSRCKWQIYTADGGYFLKNVYNSKYLCVSGSTLGVTSSLGNYGTVLYNSCVWRLVTPSSMAGTELTSLSVDSMTMWPGDSMAMNMSITPTTARWTSIKDFSVSGYSTTYVTYNSTTGVFTAKSTVTSLYSTTVTVTHKTTGVTATFSLAVKPKAVLVGVADSGHDHTSALATVSPIITGFGYSSAPLYSGSFTVSQIDNFLNNDVNSIFVSRSHGGYAVSSNVLRSTFIGPNPNDYDVLYSSTHISTTFSANELKNMDLVMFVACNTGYGGEGAANLPSKAVEKGATTAIGFEESITCSRTNEWLIDFFEGLADGYTVDEICSLWAEREYYADAHLDSYVICGNKNAKFAN